MEFCLRKPKLLTCNLGVIPFLKDAQAVLAWWCTLRALQG